MKLECAHFQLAMEKVDAYPECLPILFFSNKTIEKKKKEKKEEKNQNCVPNTDNCTPSLH